MATARSAVTRNFRTRAPDPAAQSVADGKHRAVYHQPPVRRAEGDDRSDSIRLPYRRGSCEDTAQAVPDEMHPAARLRVRPINCRVELPGEAVGTIGGEADAGIIRPVPDPPPPPLEFEKAEIHPEQSGD